ncbi:carboxypeptidase-like regulatory domain-containing protein [Spirosoma areae]
MKWILVLAFSGGIAGQTIAQTRLITGHVTSPDGSPLTDVYVVTNKPRSIGTMTNQDGDFRLMLSSQADSLSLSRLGYQPKQVAVLAELRVMLQPAAIQLAEVTVKPQKAQALIQKTIAAMPVNYGQEPEQVRGFYREIIRDQTDYLSVAEAVFDLLSFPGKKETLQLRLVQGRASNDVKATRLFDDFHPGGGPLLAAGLDIRLNPPTFLQPDFLDKYEYALDSMTTLDARQVYTVRFDQKEGVRESLQKGTVFIDADTYAVVRFEGGLSPRGLPYLKHLTGSDKVMAKVLNITLKRQQQDVRADYRFANGKWQLAFAAVDQSMSYQQPKKELDLQVAITTELVITERSTAPVQPIASSDKWLPKNLIINLATDYDEAFWGQNTIISPTKAVRAIVAGFDRQEATNGSVVDSVWQVFKPQSVKLYQQQGAILMKPLMKSGWKDAETGPMLYQTRQGNFRVETRVQVSKATDTTAAPDRGFQAGGLLIRQATGDAENHLFLGVGTGGNANLKLLLQNTVRGQSAVQPTKAAAMEWYLRIERQGARFSLSARPPDEANWTLLKTIDRADFPDTVQIGLATYADFTGNGPKMRPDLRVRFQHTAIQP